MAIVGIDINGKIVNQLVYPPALAPLIAEVVLTQGRKMLEGKASNIIKPRMGLITN